MRYWLMKSEPDVFGIEDLKKKPKQTAPWDGVRNFQARNFLRDEMKQGDLAFFYHSSCAVPGIAGIIKIVHTGYPDATAFDPKHEHYDPRSTPDRPLWYMVDVKLIRTLKRVVTLGEIKTTPALKHMRLVQRGNRLSILPVTAKEWKTILALAARPASP
jgi:predicted RNA-binding protein with PUA-like domain